MDSSHWLRSFFVPPARARFLLGDPAPESFDWVWRRSIRQLHSMMNARIVRQQPLCSTPLREDPSRVRVLHLITHLAYGGIERWLLDVIKRLRNSMSGIGVLCKGADTGPLTQSAVEFG